MEIVCADHLAEGDHNESNDGGHPLEKETPTGTGKLAFAAWV